VLVNLMIWDEHAGLAGIMWLIVCLGGATAYTQAPPPAESATWPV
jgi:hypothetical protein